MEIELIADDLGNEIWDINFEPQEVKQFFEWLNQLESWQVAVKVNGSLYRFSSLQEIACFTYGMSLMYNMITETSIKELHERQQKEAAIIQKETREKVKQIISTALNLNDYVREKEKELTALTNDIVIITHR